MLRTRDYLLASTLLLTLILSVAYNPANAQTTAPSDTKLSLRAVLVLSPEFCATTFKPKGSWAFREIGTFEVGKAACEEFESTLKGVFPNLTRAAAIPPPEDAQIVLLPRFIDVDASHGTSRYSQREMVVVLGWTVKDVSGKTIWIETVQGSAKHPMGGSWAGSSGQVKITNLLVTNSVKDASQQSASKMAASLVLRKLAQQTTPAAAPVVPPAKAPAAQVP
jgi:hypothetical protein